MQKAARYLNRRGQITCGTDHAVRGASWVPSHHVLYSPLSKLRAGGISKEQGQRAGRWTRLRRRRGDGGGEGGGSNGGDGGLGEGLGGFGFGFGDDGGCTGKGGGSEGGGEGGEGGGEGGAQPGA